MCRNWLHPLVLLKKKKKNPVLLGEARFLGWRLPVRTALGSMTDGTERGQMPGGLVDALLAGSGVRHESLQTSPTPDMSELLVKHASVLPSRLSGTVLFLIDVTVLERGSRTTPFLGQGTFPGDTLGTRTYFLWPPHCPLRK